MGDLWLIIGMLFGLLLFIEAANQYVQGWLARAMVLGAVACVVTGLSLGQTIF